MTASALLLAEITQKRARLDRELEETEGQDNAIELIEEIQAETVDFQHNVLLAIADSRVDPVDGAKAALGQVTV
jgi:hypothetical protein